MKRATLLLLVILRLFGCRSSDNPAGPDKYGPFNASVTDTHLCKGPKRADCGRVSLTSSEDLSLSSFSVSLPEKVKIEQVKIVLYPEARAGASPDVSWRVARPCSHVALAPSLRALYNVSYQDCSVRKGEYRFNVSFTSAILQFAGGQFFYGTYRSKFLLLSKNCNVMCLLNEIVVTKK